MRNIPLSFADFLRPSLDDVIIDTITLASIPFSPHAYTPPFGKGRGRARTPSPAALRRQSRNRAKRKAANRRVS